ncbi:MAG: hypothetical protein O3C40_13880 [Planctomycetota bacterium]|nr:hypothetical protein [Planctomycetota bacterium]
MSLTKREAFRRQRKAARHNLELLGAINAQSDLLKEGFGELAKSLKELKATTEEVREAIETQTAILEAGFDVIAHLLIAQQRTLQEITQLLRNPYEAKAKELLREASRALDNGARTCGRDQKEHFKEAVSLLQGVLNNPIGRRDYLAWFDLGWLQWKFKGNLTEAAEAFYHAGRLSASQDVEYCTVTLEGYSRSPRLQEMANRLQRLGGTMRLTALPPRKNPTYVESVRHLAYMQYLQGKDQDAYATIQKILTVAGEDHDVLYDAARYAARTQRAKDALALLEKCIDLRPETIVTMFSEPDFVS